MAYSLKHPLKQLPFYGALPGVSDKYTVGGDVGYLPGHNYSDDPSAGKQYGGMGPYTCKGAYGCEPKGSDPYDPQGLQ